MLGQDASGRIPLIPRAIEVVPWFVLRTRHNRRVSDLLATTSFEIEGVESQSCFSFLAIL